MMNKLKKLSEFANFLDKTGEFKKADKIDAFLNKYAQESSSPVQPLYELSRTLGEDLSVIKEWVASKGISPGLDVASSASPTSNISGFPEQLVFNINPETLDKIPEPNPDDKIKWIIQTFLSEKGKPELIHLVENISADMNKANHLVGLVTFKPYSDFI